jgi:spermidine/putrescine transport system substrate-binding protein
MKYYAQILASIMALFFVFMVVASPAATAEKAKKLYVFNWSQYMDPAILKKFEKKYAVKVVRNFYESNPELFAKLRAGGDSQYDVIFPSDYFVPRLIKSGLVQKLAKSKIPNLDNLMPKFKNPDYDPHSQYSVAYQWGDTGVVYNTKDFPNPPHSWSILFDPKVNSKYPFGLANDAQFMFGIACAYQGHGYTCTDKNDWKQGARLLIKTKKRPNFSGFIQGTPILKRIARGNVAVGPAFNGDYVRQKSDSPEAFADTQFFIPKEGTQLWVDTMAIPAHAPHPELANQFINFILKAKIGAQLSNWNHYATPNKAAVPYLDEKLRKPPMTPTKAQMKLLHFTPPLSGKKLHLQEQLWSEVKSR